MDNLPHPIKPVIEAAIRAPSGDNCQPWSFKIKGEQQFEITTVPKSAESFFDFESQGTLLSLGAVIENARTQAAEEGYNLEIDYTRPSEGEAQSVGVTLTPTTTTTPNRKKYVSAMLTRTVTRRPFVPSRIKPAIESALSEDRVEGINIDYISDRSQINRWSRLVYLADKIRYSHPQIHHELFSKIVYKNDPKSNEGIGLEIDRLGAGPGGGLIMKTIEPWDRMKKLSRFGVDKVLAGHSRFLTLCSGALCLLSFDDSNTFNWIKAGEQMERIWINAQHSNYCVHPVTVALYLDHRYQKEGMKNFLPHHEPLLKEIRAELASLLKDKTGAILFRVGKGMPMNSTSVRMPLEKFIRNNDEQT